MDYSGRTSAYAHKHGNWQEADLSDTPPALSQVRMLNAQWTDCPVEIEEVVEKLWRFHELGNDNYMLRRSINDLLELEGCEVEHWDDELYAEKKIGWHKIPLDVSPLVEYLRNKGVPDDEEIIIHWWW